MGTQNDGQIPGGPTTAMIKQQRESHICSLVFSGQQFDYTTNVRAREHASWRYEDGFGYWRLTDYQEGLVLLFGFQYINQIHFQRHDRDLILSLVERWWPGRNTFQLPFGEMTIILADVANILGLPITGEPIIFDEDASFCPETVLRDYLGVEDVEVYGKSFVTFSWLRLNFMYLDRIGDRQIEVDDNRIVTCTRAYLLGLINGILFPDSGDRVNIRFLPFLDDLSEPTPHAWGAAVLAFLYSSMSKFVQFDTPDKTMKNLSGCVTLVQVWSYEHFYIGRPVSRIDVNDGVFPSALRWMTAAADPARCAHKDVTVYRGQFDSLRFYEANYLPYRLGQNPPEIQINAYELSLHRFFIIFHDHIMYHPADRVTRQFWMIQNIPDEPPCYNRGRGNATVRARRLLPGWNSRFETHSVANLSQQMIGIQDAYGDIAYMTWWGTPFISNRAYEYAEFRFRHRAIDDHSLRHYYDYVEGMIPDLNIAYQNHPVNDQLSTMVGEFLGGMQLLEVPPYPTLHIPEGYPHGIVGPRQARPPRKYTSVWYQADSPPMQDDEVPHHQADSPPLQAAEGTSQPAGQDTSHWGTADTSRWAGEGTSQPAGQDTSHWGTYQAPAGAGTSQWGTYQAPAGAGTSQWDTYQAPAGAGTSHWGTYQAPVGAGTSQWDEAGTSQWTREGDSQWDNLFGVASYTQILTTPSAPLPTQMEDIQGDGDDEDPEDTRGRRDRLGLREIDRPNYRQLNRRGRR